MTNQYQKTGIVATFLFFLLFILAGNAFSQETSDPSAETTNATQEEPLPVLPQITVTGVRIAPMTGATILDRELIENLPSRNGTLNELISIVPGVQYSETSNHSFTGGEITPPGVSISGSRFYENNYTIDGFNNNSALDPATTSTNDISILPGHPQQIFLDPHLIDQITVYNSNIPAEHGGFTGGMVAAETLDPVDELWGNINYRTTNDYWTKFHIHPDNQEDFDNSETEANQPRFIKHDGGFSLNTPLGNDMGLLTSYQRLQSDIPLLHFGETKEQSRLSENFFIKYGYHLSNKSRLYLTTIYAPYKNEYFKTDKSSDYTIDGRTSTASAKFEQDIEIGTVSLSLGYSQQKTERKAPVDRFKWDTNTASIDWDSGLEGGNGPLDTSQEDLEIKSAFTFQEFSTATLTHQAKIGFEAEHSKQTYDRPVTSYYYRKNSTDDPTTIVCNGDVACIDNEQYLLQRYVYEKASSEASYNRYAAYLQDAMSWHRLELFPGVRISHDNYTDNLDIAPRFSAAYDIFANRKTILFGGANRYYSGSLLTHKLREALSASGLYEERSSLTEDFVTKSEGLYLWEVTNLKTPYSDELTLGFIQVVFGGELKAQYVERTNKDELARDWTYHQPDDGYRYYQLNNNGRTEHESYQLSWNRSWRNHYLEINGTYQETTTSNLVYTDSVDLYDVNDPDDKDIRLVYNGTLLDFDESPRIDFNRPAVANLIYSGILPFNTSFTSTIKYRDAYYYMKKTGTEFIPATAEEKSVLIIFYEKEKNHSAVTVDWRFTWPLSSGSNCTTLLTLDIYNVFNEKAYISSSDDEFELGRQFWAGVDINF